MTTTRPNTSSHTCTFCGFDYNKAITEIVPEGQDCHIIYCGQCHEMEALRVGPEWSTVFQIAQ